MAFRKFDLHVHTPKSACYEDHISPEKHLNTQPEDIIKAALAAGLDAIAITDHNTAANIDRLREVGARMGLAVFPGTEITSKAGHVLAIFDRDAQRQDLEHLIGQLGFKKEQEGDAYFETAVLMDQVCLGIEQMGGVAIAAHIERRPRGFIASIEPLRERIRIHSSEHITALEITVPADKRLWNEGLVPNFPTKHACLTDSDAHAPWEIGRRFSYIDMAEINLASIKAALKDYRDRIRFEGEPLTTNGNGATPR